MNQYIFDVGRRVASGGYNMPLLEWRSYYTINVIGTRAISHDQFCREFPEAAQALAESDARHQRMEKFLGNDQAMAALMEVVDHLEAGKSVHLVEAPMETPAEDQKDTAAETPAETAVDQATDGHTHKMNMDAQGNGTTDEVNGHAHQLQGGQCMAADGHTHAMPEGD